MRFSNFLPVVIALAAGTDAYWKGFNIGGNKADGISCKSSTDWARAFEKVKTFPNKINSVRLYTSHGCNTLNLAVPHAIRTDTRVLVGINSELEFEKEKGALLSAVKKYGFGWIAAVSVGSENLYRKSISPTKLANQIYDVRGMLKQVPGYTKEIKVGHVDTTDAWFNVSNAPVIRACEFVGTDIYPYFQSLQNNSIENAGHLFQYGIQQVKTAVVKAKGNAAVWVTETGWPINGPTKNLAVPSVQNARKYWKDVACSAFSSINTFWFTMQDYKAVPSFALIDEDSNQIYSQTC